MASDRPSVRIARRVWGAIAAAVLAVAAVSAWGWSRAGVRAEMMRVDPEAVLTTPRLRRPALQLGRAVYERRCASCHEADGRGSRVEGVPDLRDGDHLYGVGRVAEIEWITLHGIRAGDAKGWTLASMPVFASPHPYKGEPIDPLSPQDIADVTQYVESFQGRAADIPAAQRGGEIYQTGGACWDCHGHDGRGDPGIGAPNLTDDIWLYGDGSPAAIARSLEGGRAGVSPAFAHRIGAVEARAVAAYVASLAPPPPATQPAIPSEGRP